MIAIGCKNKSKTKSSKLFLCEYNEFTNLWTKTESIRSVTYPVHDLKFAPNIGRSYCLLGVATNNVRILKLTAIKYVVMFIIVLLKNCSIYIRIRYVYTVKLPMVFCTRQKLQLNLIIIHVQSRVFHGNRIVMTWRHQVKMVVYDYGMVRLT